MTPQLILFVIIVIVLLDYVFTTGLELLNLRYQPASLPDTVSDIYSQEEFEKAQAYHRATTRFGTLSASVTTIVWLALLVTGSLGWLDNWVGTRVNIAWLQPLVTLGLLALLFELISLPFAIYRTFSIEAAFGFNKMTPTTFVADKLKGYGLTVVLGGGLLLVFLWLAQWLGAGFWLYFWLIISVILIFINMFYTTLLLPLFNKLTPLPAGDLKTALSSYAVQEGFELTDTLVMDSSKRSSKVNAFFSGLGREKKVVLYDTMLDKLSYDEIVAVVAHEVGHYKRGHIPKLMASSVLTTGLVLFILSRFLFSENLSLALGANGLSLPLNLIAFALFFAPLNHVIGYFSNILSRKFEFEADAFATSTASSSSMIAALKHLSSVNLSNLTPHPLYARMHYTHPPVTERIAAILNL